jgi:hypothetical protein
MTHMHEQLPRLDVVLCTIQIFRNVDIEVKYYQEDIVGELVNWCHLACIASRSAVVGLRMSCKRCTTSTLVVSQVKSMVLYRQRAFRIGTHWSRRFRWLGLGDDSGAPMALLEYET